MKRQILTIAGLIAALTCWTGCGGKETASEEATVEVQETSTTTISQAEHMESQAKAKAQEIALQAKADAIAEAERLKGN